MTTDEQELLPPGTCDNCGNDVGVELTLEVSEENTSNGFFWCMPCREAKLYNDEGTFSLRRTILRGEDDEG